MPGVREPATPPSHLDYLDFNLQVGPPDPDGRHPVTVRLPAGDVYRERVAIPHDQLALDSHLTGEAIVRAGAAAVRHLAAPSAAPSAPSLDEFGRALFDAVVRGEVRSAYDVSRDRSRRDDKQLRLKMDIKPPELAALPWEFLYGPLDSD